MNADQPRLRFTCSRCDEDIVEEIVDLPGFDYGAEVHSEGRGIESLDVTCGTCGKEYQVEISNLFDQFEAEVVGAADLEVELDIEPDYDDSDYDYQEYLKSYVPGEPGERYKHSLQLLDAMVADAGPLNSYPTFHRMLLLQHVAMMEAYLCDRMITLVGIEAVRTNLVKGYADLQNQKIPLVAFATNPNLLFERTVACLKAQLYHELDDVEKMYRAALGQTPFETDGMKNFLKAAMINRHHCVHRDGKNNDGEVLAEVNAVYIDQVRGAISGLVAHIEATFAAEIDQVRPKLPF
jgi:transcription elongation factor Elf1